MDDEEDYSYDPGEQGYDAGEQGFEPDAFDDDVGPDDYDVDPIPPPPPATEPQDIPDPPTSDDEYENTYDQNPDQAPDVQPPSYTDYSASAQVTKSQRDVGEKEVAGTLFGYFRNYPTHVIVTFFSSIIFLGVNLGIILTILFLETGINFISIFILGYVSTDKDHYYNYSVFTLVAMVMLILALIPILSAFVCGFLQAFFAIIRLHFLVPPFAQCYCINLCCCCMFTLLSQFVIGIGVICWFAVNKEGLTIAFGAIFCVFMCNTCFLLIVCVGPCICCGFCVNQTSSQVSMFISMFTKKEIKRIGGDGGGGGGDDGSGLSRD